MYNKVGNIDLETTAKYETPIKTGIRYYNTDTGVATLEFNLTRKGYPLMVSEKNTHSFIILKTGPEHYIVDDVTYSDPLRGKVSYTIPSNFLSVPGKVHGQLYVNVRGTEDVITQVDFYFDIEDAVINTIPVVEKVRIIRTFAELQKNVNVQMADIKEQLSNGKETLDEIKSVIQNGLNDMKSAKETTVNEITKIKDSTTTEVKNIKTTIIDDINNVGKSVIENINNLNAQDTSNWQQYKLTNKDGTRNWLGSLNTPIEKLNTGFYECIIAPDSASAKAPVYDNIEYYAEIDVTTGTDNKKQIKLTRSDSKDIWIKTIHTNGQDKGWSKVVTQDNLNKRQNLGTLSVSVFSLKAGSYECIVPSDNRTTKTPKVDVNINYPAHIDVYEGINNKLVNLYDINNNEFYTATLDSNGVSKGWRKVYSYPDNTKPFYDTGWIDFQLENGTKDRSLTVGSGTLYSNQYRVVKMFGVTQVYLRLNVNNITSESVIGRIPSKLVNKAQTDLMRTSTLFNPVTCTIDVDGTIKLYVNQNDKLKWDTDGYAIGSMQWILDSNDFFVETPTTTFLEGESPDDLNDVEVEE
ncbi:BppU family phage baseplate upper protein [Staphylococcus agnetis]|uniref:BppU family phage baseplate upper protein n=1 Tax=Staphylococcus agnetis TaxID=985762 RepID=UPI00208E80F9|nr:BppU family phage baseplate upper protein [Staphylococcus agnetis]MCO4339532.1 BppU family phage baseplate upper protein [Staphylococcus agnetis]